MTITEYIQTYAPRFRGHTPGHKGSLDSRDITEIAGEFPEAQLAESQRMAAAIYGAKSLRFLTNGSSIGIKAAVLTLGEDFVTDGYCHRAVTEAAALAGVECYKLPLRVDPETSLPELPTAESVANEMRGRGVRNAVIQYPDYYGRTPDLARIYAAVRAEGGKLICDSAHGAHFVFRPDLFPTSAVKLSDVCNLSAHKTLCAMTQTAYLAVGGNFDAEGLDFNLKLLGTTSPNYLLLSSLETAIAKGLETAGEYDNIKAYSEAFAAEFPCLKNDDFTRLVIDFEGIGGERAAQALKKCGVFAEKYDDRYVIIILTPFDGDREILTESVRKVYGGKI